MPKDKDTITKDELVKMLNNPQELAAAAAKLGMKLSPREEIKEEKLERPAGLELGEDLNPKSLMDAINKALSGHMDYVEKLVGGVQTKVAKDLDYKEMRQVAKEVQEFAKSHPHFKDLLEDIDPLWKAGQSLEDAYLKACKMKGIDPTKAPKVKPTGSSQDEDTSSKKSSPRVEDEEVETEDIKPKEHKSIRDAAKAGLKDMLAKDPSIQKAISEEVTEE